MQLCAQWWLVITNPSGETKLPEQPPASRTELSCASESHCASGAKPYFCCTFFEGKLSYVHMPSSARADAASVRAQHSAICFIGYLLGRGALCSSYRRASRTSRRPDLTAPRQALKQSFKPHGQTSLRARPGNRQRRHQDEDPRR